MSPGKWLAVVTLLCSPVSAQSPFVYSVNASGCAGGVKSRTQTGFRVMGKKGIVTALHGVVGCSTITVKSEKGLVLYDPVELGQVDVDNDVALLISRELNSKPTEGFEIDESGTLASGTKVTVLGHPYGIKALSTTFALRNPPVVQLRNLVPDDVLDRLSNRSSPNPMASVVSLESGNLLPGHSGAPVLNSRERVIGVADGGLKGGTVQISWAIPYGQIRWVNPPSSLRFQNLQKTSDVELFDYDGSAVSTEERLDSEELAKENEAFNRAVQSGDETTFLRYFHYLSPSGKNWALNYLAKNGGPDGMVLMLLDVGADMNAGFEGSAPPLFLAVANKHENIVRLLAERKGLDINAIIVGHNVFKAEVRHHILQEAVNDCHQRLDILATLLAVPGIDANPKDIFGKTPLQNVVNCNWIEAVDLLLKTPGIDINAVDSQGESALDLTLLNCRLNAIGCQIADKLLSHGARPYAHTAAEFAEGIADAKRDHKLH